jgi:hypothetical protein
MTRIKDFALLLDVTPRTIHNYIKNFKPLFKNFKKNSRKVIYNQLETEILLNHIIKYHSDKFNRKEIGNKRKLA